MIECFRERGWFDWADKLEVALLRGYISLIDINIIFDIYKYYFL